MQLWYRTRSLLCSFLAIVSCLCVLSSAETKAPASGNTRSELSSGSGSAGKNKIYGFGGEIGYVAPYVWKGIPITNGPCIQPEFWVSVWEFKFGVFMNLFASNKDNTMWKLNTTTLELTVDSGECSQSFGMINQVDFFLYWEHSFNDAFSLLAGYTQYAYGKYIEVDTLLTKYIKRYGWFNNNASYGEFTIKPCFKIGMFNLFTEQNFVLIAPEQSFIHENTSAQWVTLKDSRFGSYHGVFGIKIEKELSDEFAGSLIIQEEIANKKFFETFYRNPENGQTVTIEGAYQRNATFAVRYTPWPWFVFSAHCGAEFITKETLSTTTGAKGAFLFGGVNTKYSW